MESNFLPSTYIRINYYPLLIDSSSVLFPIVLLFLGLSLCNKVCYFIADNISDFFDRFK